MLPALLMVATVAWYSTNPVAMLVLCSVMLLGCLYLLTYSEAFAPAPA